MVADNMHNAFDYHTMLEFPLRELNFPYMWSAALLRVAANKLNHVQMNTISCDIELLYLCWFSTIDGDTLDFLLNDYIHKDDLYYVFSNLEKSPAGISCIENDNHSGLLYGDQTLLRAWSDRIWCKSWDHQALTDEIARDGNCNIAHYDIPCSVNLIHLFDADSYKIRLLLYTFDILNTFSFYSSDAHILDTLYHERRN